MPSGNSILISCFSKIAMYTGDNYFDDEFDSQLGFFMGKISRYPRGHTAALMGIMEAAYSRQKLVCVFRNDMDFEEAKMLFSQKFAPFTMVVLKMEHDSGEYKIPDGKDKAFYLCSDNVCKTPAFSLKEIFAQI